MQTGKNPLASKTLWFNVLALIVLVADPFGFQEHAADPNVAPLAAGIAALINVVLPILSPLVNIVLRLVTKEPLRLRR